MGRNYVAFNTHKQQAITAAKELFYGEDTIKKLKEAKTEAELDRILKSARLREMIYFQTESYCQNCPDLEPSVDVCEVGTNRYNTYITCEHADICAAIYERIKKEYKDEQSRIKTSEEGKR